MNLSGCLTSILDSPVVYRLGWALIHSLWLGAAVVAALAGLLALLRRRSANARYVAGCIALGATVILAIGAFAVVQPRLKQAQSEAAVEPAAAPRTSAPSDRLARPDVRPSQESSGIARSEDVPLPPETPTPAPGAGSEATPVAERAWEPWAAKVSSALEPLLPWIVLAWSLGVCALLVWHTGGMLVVDRLRRQAREPAAAGLVETAARLARALRISWPVRLLESAAVHVPTVVGWLRPVILLPVRLATGLSSEQIEAVLAHEPAHNWGLKDWRGAEATFGYANDKATAIASPFDQDTGKWRHVTGLWTGAARSGTIALDGAQAPGGAASSPPSEPPRTIRFKPEIKRSVAYLTGLHAEVYLVADDKVIQLLAPLAPGAAGGPVEFNPAKDKSEAWLFEGKDVSKYVLPAGRGRVPAVPPAVPGEPDPKPLYTEQKASAGAFTLTNLPAKDSYKHGGVTEVKVKGLSFPSGTVTDIGELRLKFQPLPP